MIVSRDHLNIRDEHDTTIIRIHRMRELVAGSGASSPLPYPPPFRAGSVRSSHNTLATTGSATATSLPIRATR